MTVLVGLVFAATLACSISAAIVYVQTGGTGTGASDSSPVGTLSDAISMLHGLLRKMPDGYNAASYFHIEKLTLLHVLELLRFVAN